MLQGCPGRDRMDLLESTCHPHNLHYACLTALLGVRVMVFNTTFNNISVIWWRSVVLVEETRENHQPAASH
jgi:hypothetical protein